MRKKWTENEIQFIKDNYEIMSDEELGKHLSGHPLSSIITKRKDLGCKRIGNKKYTYEDVQKFISQKGYTLITPKFEPFNCSMYVDYICPIHGRQKIQIAHLLRDNQGCPQCGKNNSIQNRRIDITSNEIQKEHKNLCERLDLIYVDTIRRPIDDKNHYRIFIEYICKKHQIEGVQIKEKYALQKSKIPCRYCNHKKLPKDYILKLAKDGSPNIEILSDDFEKINDYVDCKCLIHNKITKKCIRDIILNRSCYYCGLDKLSNYSKLSDSEISNRIHSINNKIEYISGYDGANKRFKVRCKVCGYEWETYLHSVNLCPCCENFYHGEKYIENYLIKNQIKYVSQKKFDDCKYKHKLSFDFYLPDKNICIEYQGQQHYVPIEYFGGIEKFHIQQIKDGIKRDYCKENNIKLVEISYKYDTQEKVTTFLQQII